MAVPAYSFPYYCNMDTGFMPDSLYDPNFSVTRSAEKFRNNNAGAEFDLSPEKLDRSHEMSDGSTRNKTVLVTS